MKRSSNDIEISNSSRLERQGDCYGFTVTGVEGALPNPLGPNQLGL